MAQLDDLFNKIEDITLNTVYDPPKQEQVYFIRNYKRNCSLDSSRTLDYIHFGKRKSKGPLGRMKIWDNLMSYVFVDLQNALRASGNYQVKRYRNNFFSSKIVLEDKDGELTVTCPWIFDYFLFFLGNRIRVKRIKRKKSSL